MAWRCTRGRHTRACRCWRLAWLHRLLHRHPVNQQATRCFPCSRSGRQGCQLGHQRGNSAAPHSLACLSPTQPTRYDDVGLLCMQCTHLVAGSGSVGTSKHKAAKARKGGANHILRVSVQTNAILAVVVVMLHCRRGHYFRGRLYGVGHVTRRLWMLAEVTGCHWRH